MAISIKVNGEMHEIAADPATPLLYILRNELALNGAKFGCGLGQCGSCTVHVGGKPVYSCLLPLAAVGEREIATIESLGKNGSLSAIQQAFIDEQAAQCGYCIAGMIMRAEALLRAKSNPTEDEIRDFMQPNLCRCGTHMRILRAVRRAADRIRSTDSGAGHGGRT
jgi:aerobic-type carbon monoxide dehydrogenase small subunit (CoxS/CutS family)